jgi:hypothetical protein
MGIRWYGREEEKRGRQVRALGRSRPGLNILHAGWYRQPQSLSLPPMDPGAQVVEIRELCS